MTTPHLPTFPSLIVACVLLHNIILNTKDEVDETLVLWGHHDEGYRQQLSRVPPTNES